MKSDRRTFLRWLGFGGAAVAAVVFTPFSKVNKPIREYSGNLELFRAKTDAILNPSLDYQIIIVDDKGNHLWAPRMKSFDQDDEKCSVSFHAQDVAIDRTCVLVSAKLMNPDGFLIGTKLYSGPIPVVSGDILKLTYTQVGSIIE